MIEVLIPDRVALPDETVIACYCDKDRAIARSVLARVGVPWKVAVADAPDTYTRNAHYVAAVEAFVEQAIADASWRGNGLEFDRV